MHGNCRSLAENLALYGEELRPRKKEPGIYVQGISGI